MIIEDTVTSVREDRQIVYVKGNLQVTKKFRIYFRGECNSSPLF